MGCSDSNVLNMSDSFNATKIPKSTSSSCSPRTTIASTIAPPLLPPPPPYCSYTYNSTQFLPLNHHLGNKSNKQSEIESLGSSASRWNPTPEQLLALEEMYRHGIRTPSSEQIQQMAAQLRRFGKIEGKNVFYWFQNHKARERQKRRREMETMISSDQVKQVGAQHPEKKDSGLRRTLYEAEQTKNRVPPSRCTLLPEEFVSMHRASMAEGDDKTRVGPRFEEKELQLRGSSIALAAGSHATWQPMNLSCSPPPSPSANKLLDTQNILEVHHQTMREKEETQTLELFPLHGDDDHGAIDITKDFDLDTKAAINPNFNSSKFFEFLPLKN